MIYIIKRERTKVIRMIMTKRKKRVEKEEENVNKDSSPPETDPFRNVEFCVLSGF